MNILAIDPGNVESGWVLYDDSTRKVLDHGIDQNDNFEMRTADACVVEMIASYGMPVGREVFETCVWIGQLVERWAYFSARGGDLELIYRKDVKLAICHNAHAKDPHIRQALLDRFGPGKELAVGTKRSPGPLYGIRGHEWAALALAVTYSINRTPF